MKSLVGRAIGVFIEEELESEELATSNSALCAYLGNHVSEQIQHVAARKMLRTIINYALDDRKGITAAFVTAVMRATSNIYMAALAHTTTELFWLEKSLFASVYYPLPNGRKVFRPRVELEAIERAWNQVLTPDRRRLVADVLRVVQEPPRLPGVFLPNDLAALVGEFLVGTHVMKA
jgi:hypothetical protein